MSDMARVTFGLSPYEHAQQGGFKDCSAISAMQVNDGDVLNLVARGRHARGPATSFLEMDLPVETAENLYTFLRVHDALAAAHDVSDTAHANCHVISAVARGWVRPDAIEPTLLVGHRLGKDEVKRVRPRNLGQLKPGEVYSFTDRYERRPSRDGVRPTHSIMPLPVPGLHISQLGWRGNPYIGSDEGAFEFYTGDDKGLYLVPEKPRDIGTDAWFARAKQDTLYTDEYWADRQVVDFARAARLIQGLGAAPVHGALASV